MNKKFNKYLVLGILIGLSVSVVSVYAATTYLAGDVKYKDTTVEKALNDLYLKKDLFELNLNLEENRKFNLSLPKQYTYSTENNEIVTINSDGLIEPINIGNSYINVLENNKKVGRINVKIVPLNVKIIGGKDWYFLSYNKYPESSDLDTMLETVNNYLFDNDHSKQGGYGGLLMDGNSKLYFQVKEKTNISFSSNIYSDGGGSSGKEFIIYKIDDKGDEIEYHRFTQINNSKNYGKHLFEAGNYIARVSGNYVEFDEWIVEPIK